MMEFDANGIVEYGTRSKRTRLEQSKCNDGSGARTLELHEVITTLKAYDADSADGGINCSICGEFCSPFKRAHLGITVVTRSSPNS